MPELPEVETTVNYLKKKVLGRKILSFWTDTPKLLKKPKLADFGKLISGKKITNIKRFGKNILFYLEGNLVMLIHQKLSGHLLFGKWEIGEKVKAKIKGPLATDPQNRFIRFVWHLDNGWQLGLSDLRKFAKIELDAQEKIEAELFKNLGPDALKISFKEFQERINKFNRLIKEVLMDQKVVAGIGNIYADEILWQAKVSPFLKARELKEDVLKRIYRAMKFILKKALKAKGTSIDDYRLPNGNKGGYQDLRKVYQREGEPCFRCQNEIKRIKIKGRSAHFCPVCQKTPS
jgi:formamidopyrimidine-DNA glycosylase